MNYRDAKVLCFVDFGGTAPRIPVEGHRRVKVVYLGSKLSCSSSGLYINSESFDTFVGLLSLALDHDQSKWLFVLEDDVLVLAPVNKLKYSLNGSNRNERLGALLRLFIFMSGGTYKVSDGFGGCGGSILEKAALRRGIQNNASLLRTFLRLSGRKFGSDELLTALIASSRGSIGGYEGFLEMWESDARQKISSGEATTVHKYRDFYR